MFETPWPHIPWQSRQAPEPAWHLRRGARLGVEFLERVRVELARDTRLSAEKINAAVAAVRRSMSMGGRSAGVQSAS